MKRLFLTYFIALFCNLSSFATVYSGSCGTNANWSLNVATGVLSISGTGAMTDYDGEHGAPWNSTQVFSIYIDEGISSIGDFAFDGCSGVTTITIPNSVTDIGWASFAFCTGLTSISIPNSVTMIDRYAFFNCSGLTSIIIPKSIISIGGYAFDGCLNITTIEWNAIHCHGFNRSQSPFSNIASQITSFTFGKDVSFIPNYLCDGMNQLDSIVIPNSVTHIGIYAFSGCSSLTSVTIGNSVTSIGEWAFSSCSGLTSINIPQSITYIGDYAFFDCSSLTSITIPNSVTSIGRSAFNGCSNLTSFAIDAFMPPSLGGSLGYSGTVLLNCRANIQAYLSSIDWSEYNFIIPEPNYTLSLSCDSVYGSYDVLLVNDCMSDTTIIQAIPSYGYHFAQWSDGNTDNPRTLILESDSSIIAEFAKNTYSVVVSGENGSGNGSGDYLYLDTTTISALPATGFQFNQWSDGNTDNPRQIVITCDTAFTAEFGIKQCELILSVNNDAWGIVSGNGVFDYKTAVTCTATAMSGYEFVKWSDGSTYNPYQLVIFDDMELTAEFAEIGQGIYQNKLDKSPEKLVVDGILYIRRGDSLYDAQGRMLK